MGLLKTFERGTNTDRQQMCRFGKHIQNRAIRPDSNALRYILTNEYQKQAGACLSNAVLIGPKNFVVTIVGSYAAAVPDVIENSFEVGGIASYETGHIFHGSGHGAALMNKSSDIER